MRLTRANIRKLVRRPATWVTFLLLLVLLGLIYLALIASTSRPPIRQAPLAARAVVTFPGAYAGTVSLILGIGGLLAVTYGAAIAGSEWTWGTLKAAVARGESRTRYTLFGFLAIAIMVFLGFLASFLVGVALAALGSTLLNVPLSGMSDQDAFQCPGAVRPGDARAVDGRGPRVRDRHDRAQPARRHRRRDRRVLLRGDRRRLPARRLQVVPVLRGIGGRRLDRRRGRRWAGPARLEPDIAIVVVLVWLVAALVIASLWTERAEIAG